MTGKRLLKISYLLLILLLITWYRPVRGQVLFVPSGGLNLSQLNLDMPGLKDFQSFTLTGFQVGGDLRIGRKIFAQVGAFYHQYGNRLEWTDSLGLSEQTNIVIQGVMVPLKFGYSVYDAEILRIRLLAGINLAFPTGMNSNSLDLLKEDLNGSNVQIAFGFGFDVFRFVLSADFGFGMNDLFSDKSLNSSKNIYLVNIGYLFGKV